MNTFFAVVVFIIFLFFFLNRSNSNMKPWVQWVGWGMVMIWIISKIVEI